MRASLPQLMNRYPVPVRRGLADQLVEHLITAILRGDHPPDSQLPPEGRLAELFDVSRLTVREAVKALRSKGVVRIEQGRGTFVNPPSHWSPLDPDLLMARAATAEGTRELAMKLTEARSEEHTSELQSRENLVCRLLLENKKKKTKTHGTKEKKKNTHKK